LVQRGSHLRATIPYVFHSYDDFTKAAFIIHTAGEWEQVKSWRRSEIFLREVRVDLNFLRSILILSSISLTLEEDAEIKSSFWWGVITFFTHGVSVAFEVQFKVYSVSLIYVNKVF
jgi:hypothetical protein